MKEIEVTLNISNSELEALSDEICELIQDSIVEKVTNQLEIHENISDWMREYFDINDYADDLKIVDHDRDDHDSIAYDLLDQYSPTSNCSTSQAFTEAVAKAMRYIFLKEDDHASDILRAMNSFKEHSEREKILQEEEDILRIKYFNEFKMELEKLAQQIKDENIIYPVNWASAIYGSNQ